MEVTEGVAWRATLTNLSYMVRGHRRHTRVARKYIAKAAQLELETHTQHNDVRELEVQAVRHLICAGVEYETLRALLSLLPSE